MFTKKPQVDYAAAYDILTKGIVPLCELGDCRPGEDVLRQHRTVRLSGGSRTGKTDWAIHEIINDPYTLLMLHNEYRKDIIEKVMRRWEAPADAFSRVIYFHEFVGIYNNNNKEKVLYTRVIIDDAETYPMTQLSIIYNLLSLWTGNKDNTVPLVVLLG